VILKLWLKLVSLVLICSIPLMVVFFVLQNEVVKMGFGQHQNTITSLSQYQKDLKTLARLDASNSTKYREQFYQNHAAMSDLSEIQKISTGIQQSLFEQTLLMVAGVLAISFLMSWFFASHVVNQFKILLDENRLAWQKVTALQNIESWQNVARMLVHELRTPMTPIKMVLSSLREGARGPKQLANSRIEEGAELGLEQVSYIEKMLETFSTFAKLPAPRQQVIDLDRFLEEFVDLIENLYPADAPNPDGERDHRLLDLQIIAAENLKFRADPQLWKNLLVNLVKNAIEANRPNGQANGLETVKVATKVATKVAIKVAIEIGLKNRNDGTFLCFTVANQGRTIPDEIKDKIFDLSISSKKDQVGLNLGVGLTVCRKIAMDHQGDIVLKHNDSIHGVVFEAELPYKNEEIL